MVPLLPSSKTCLNRLKSKLSSEVEIWVYIFYLLYILGTIGRTLLRGSLLRYSGHILLRYPWHILLRSFGHIILFRSFGHILLRYSGHILTQFLQAYYLLLLWAYSTQILSVYSNLNLLSVLVIYVNLVEIKDVTSLQRIMNVNRSTK